MSFSAPLGNLVNLIFKRGNYVSPINVVNLEFQPKNNNGSFFLMFFK